MQIICCYAKRRIDLSQAEWFVDERERERMFIMWTWEQLDISFYISYRVQNDVKYISQWKHQLHNRKEHIVFLFFYSYCRNVINCIIVLVYMYVHPYVIYIDIPIKVSFLRIIPDIIYLILLYDLRSTAWISIPIIWTLYYCIQTISWRVIDDAWYLNTTSINTLLSILIKCWPQKCHVN